jgi:hypothetical protein
LVNFAPSGAGLVETSRPSSRTSATMFAGFVLRRTGSAV